MKKPDELNAINKMLNIKKQWLQLIRSDNIGPLTFWALLDRFGTAQKALEVIPSLAQRTGHRISLCSEAQVDQELEAHEKRGFHLVAAFEDSFPKALRELPDCPPILSIYGRLDIFQSPCLAMVGGRTASYHGCRLAKSLAEDLSDLGWCIVSGMARGIDSAAHQGSLEKGTIAVLAGGVDHIYPQENEGLYHNIAEKGAVISEMPLGTSPTSYLFPRRNRLISGLSQGVVVIEAAARSGSLITARNALEQGREVFAVPGFPLDPRSKGSNQLIKEGAVLVENAEDIINTFGFSPISHQATLPATPPEQRQAVFSFENMEDIQKVLLKDLTTYPTPIELLVERYEWSAQQVLTALLALELGGYARRHADSSISLLQIPCFQGVNEVRG